MKKGELLMIDGYIAQIEATIDDIVAVRIIRPNLISVYWVTKIQAKHCIREYKNYIKK